MKKHNAEDIAAERMRIITPLLDEGLDRALLIERRKKAATEHRLSYRTVGRYLKAYEENGFEGLKPKTPERTESHLLPANYQKLVEIAIELRRECPSRSVRDIITILELEGHVKPGILSRSTLQRHLHRNGFGANQVKVYTQNGAAARRFQKQHRSMLWQGDIKYGPYLPIGKDGAKKQTYLAAFIDDATRFIVGAGFYGDQKAGIIEDNLRSAVMQYGLPDAIYVDNGKQYRSKLLERACMKLGIKLKFAKPYSPEAKGKIEVFNRRINSFLSEVALMEVTSLGELNTQLELWLREYYHKKEHYGLGGISPGTAFRTDTRPLKFADVEKVKEAFLNVEERKVDKTGCISFEGTKYEVGTALMGRKVEVHFDPTWRDAIEIRHEGFEPFMAKPLVIGPSTKGPREYPENIGKTKAETSRLLEGLNKANITGRTDGNVAVVFGKGEVKQNV
jgi:transposase InsO family protein